MSGVATKWFVVTPGQRTPLAPGVVFTLGRDSGCDIVVKGSDRVSRQHLEIRISEDNSTWTVRDTSSNGTAGHLGRFIEESGSHQLVLLLGGRTGPLCVITHDRDVDLSSLVSPRWPENPGEPRTQSGSGVNLELGTRFGRDADNDIVIDSLLASPHHARVFKDGDRLVLLDLGSARGTFVNGVRVKQHEVVRGDLISMGGERFRADSGGQFHRIAQGDGVSLEADDLVVRVGDQVLLDHVSFSVPPRSVVAVVGPSGSGKSTLLGALTALRPAQEGTVLIDRQDFYANYSDWRYRIGYVPQQDLVPPQLTVLDALRYAARLRFPPDTTEKERLARIDQVLADLKLTERRDLRIDRLSGGQRKRVSVALELLTRPPVLFLDEPTSGLDPGLDQQLMILLRELADDGRTVLVVTHAMDNLNLCDRVLVLAAGGHVAYYGPPAEATTYFKAADWPGVFVALDSKPGYVWADEFERTGLNDATSEIPGGSQEAPTSSMTLRQARPEGFVRQWLTLVSRTWRVTVSDRAYLTLLVALPIVLAGLGFLVGSAAGLGPGDAPDGLNPDARILLLILILGATFTGAATSIQELVKERVIYQRERAVGLSPAAYVTSKVFVLGIIALFQGVVFALLTLAGRGASSDSILLGSGHLDVAVLVGILAFTSCMLGLVLSALIPSREATLPVLVIVTMLQIVLSGAIPLRWSEIDAVLGIVVPAYWAFRGLVAVVDLPALLGPAADPDWVTGSDAVFTSLSVLCLMSVVFVILAVALVRRADPGRRR